MNLGGQMLLGIVDDFAHFSDASQMLRVTFRLALAATLGAFLGVTRARVGKAAGIRTHMLVAMGSALFVLAPREFGYDHADVSRVIQGIAAGIGFLGAGTILKQSEHGPVKGLTTAAGIWVTAGVGLAVGMGIVAIAVVATLLALFILVVVPLIGGRHEDEDHGTGT